MNSLVAILMSLNIICGVAAPNKSTQANAYQNSQNTEIVYSYKEVDKVAVIISRPEPSWTRNARINGCRHPDRIYGLVKLRAILEASGKVRIVEVLQKLPDGLTKQATNAARKIKFEPAIKDGRPVSMYLTIEYNFGEHPDC